MIEILSYLRHLYICELYAGVPFHFTPACILVHFQRTAGQIIEHQHLQCEISGLKILLLNAVELQIRQNKGTSNITHGDCAKHTTSSFLLLILIPHQCRIVLQSTSRYWVAARAYRVSCPSGLVLFDMACTSSAVSSPSHRHNPPVVVLSLLS